jgi:hypothetical protein
MTLGTMRRGALWALIVAAMVGCSEQQSGWQPADPVFQTFIDEALPVLLRDCGFHTCHGSEQRFFRVWGPGRVRLDPATREFDRLTSAEWQASYQLATSMIDARDPEHSPLLRKPLALGAGGAAHRGADRYGRNVYRSTADAGYVALRRWVLARGANAAPGASQ